MSALDEHVAWCRDIHRVLNEGGTWGVPRSGLVFTKRGQTFALTDIFSDDPTSSKEDFDAIKFHMGLAEIEVTDEIGAFHERS